MCFAPWDCSARQRFRLYQSGQTATAAKARLILRRAIHIELHLTDVVAAGGPVFVRHAGSFNLFCSWPGRLDATRCNLIRAPISSRVRRALGSRHLSQRQKPNYNFYCGQKGTSGLVATGRSNSMLLSGLRRRSSIQPHPAPASRGAVLGAAKDTREMALVGETANQ